MPDSPWFSLDPQQAAPTLRLTGAWRLAQLAEIEAALASLALPGSVAIDGSALAQIDSAAALVLLRALRRGQGATAGAEPPWVGFSDVNARIVEQVRRAHRVADGLVAARIGRDVD